MQEPEHRSDKIAPAVGEMGSDPLWCRKGQNRPPQTPQTQRKKEMYLDRQHWKQKSLPNLNLSRLQGSHSVHYSSWYFENWKSEKSKVYPQESITAINPSIWTYNQLFFFFFVLVNQAGRSEIFEDFQRKCYYEFKKNTEQISWLEWNFLDIDWMWMMGATSQFLWFS